MDLYFSIIGAIICVLILIGALYVFLKYLQTPVKTEVPGEWPKPAGTIPDDEFFGKFTAPLLTDAKEGLDLAVESLKLSIELYERKAWVESGEESISARKSVEAAMEKLDEVIDMSDADDSYQAKRANVLLGHCNYYYDAAVKIEAATDAMLEGKQSKGIPEGLIKAIEEWKAD